MDWVENDHNENVVYIPLYYLGFILGLALCPSGESGRLFDFRYNLQLVSQHRLIN